MKYQNRFSIYTKTKEKHEIEVTEWSNAEGVDIFVDNNFIAISYKDAHILKKIIREIENRK